MSDTIAHLLNRLANDESSLSDTCAQLVTLVQGGEANAEDFATRVRTHHAQGQLKEEHARALLDVLDTEKTRLRTRIAGAASTPKPTAADAAVFDPERTQIKTRNAPESATLRRTEADAEKLDHERTQVKTRTAAESVTLQRTEAASAYGQTERTEVIASRRVQNLDDAAPTPDELAPGVVVKNRFLLETLIGKGGMGLVFGAIDRRKEEARDPNPRVALKVLNADFQRHPQSFMALQREARKAQTLAHPNVVTVFDFDRDGDVVYMTMELLAGRSLESMVREARGKGIGADQALPIIRGIAEGLAYAHRKGIVHSDLKPGNVFVTKDGTPKILDFGIARAVPSSLADEVEDVFDAGSLGAYTEAYATDEMVEGVDPHPADDMYALGIIAYELLTGRHPYQRHSAPNARKLGIVPAPLKGVSRKEARAIFACLSFDRRERPQDAAEFLKAFRGISTVQKVSVAAAVVLAAVAGYVSYQNYLETSPSVPFNELPLEQQQAFREKMEEGREAWTFYERERIDDAWSAAVDYYAEAYRLHPRNREAVAALNAAAKTLLASAKTDEQRRALARHLQERSAHYRSYGPVVDAAK